MPVDVRPGAAVHADEDLHERLHGNEPRDDFAEAASDRIRRRHDPSGPAPLPDQRGRLLQGIYEFERGVVVMEPLGDSAILVVVTSAAANLGLLRLQARKVHDDLEQAISGL